MPSTTGASESFSTNIIKAGAAAEAWVAQPSSLFLPSLGAAGFTPAPLGAGMNESSVLTWQKKSADKTAEQVLGEIKQFRVICRGWSINLGAAKRRVTETLHFITFPTGKCQLLIGFNVLSGALINLANTPAGFLISMDSSPQILLILLHF